MGYGDLGAALLNADFTYQGLLGASYRFTKVFLEPGEKKEVILNLEPNAVEFWSPCSGSWISEEGKITVLVGSSSRDIRLKDSFEIIVD